MEKLYAIKDEKSEFYAQIEVGKNIWEFLGKLAYMLFDENWMIDDHYQTLWDESKINDYFSFGKDGIYLVIVIVGKRAHMAVLGLPNNSEVKKFTFENYSFE